MNNHERPGIGQILGTVFTWAGILLLLLWLVGWLLERKWGAFLIVWLLWFFGAMIVLGGALTVITGDADLADQSWPWILFAVAAAWMSAIQMRLTEKSSRSPVRKS